MREIKFRAKNIDGNLKLGTWLIGDIWKINNEVWLYPINNELGEFYKVDKNTVGQFIGFKDKTGKEIYEGDIVEYNGSMAGEVCYDEAETSYILMPLNDKSSYEVVGMQFNSRVIGHVYEEQDSHHKIDDYIWQK